MHRWNTRRLFRAERARLARCVISGVLGGAAITAPLACQKASPDEVVRSSASSGATTGVGPGTGTGTGVGTGASTGTMMNQPFTKAALLEAVADCTIDRYRDFQTHAQSLRDASSAYAANRSEANAAANRDAWIAAMASWEEAEVFRYGPAARVPEPGAQDLRDHIYAWPLVSRCKIEEQIVSQAHATPGFPQTLINGRSMTAFEYLLFYGGTDNACSQFSEINADGTWAALSADALAQRKAEYAAAVASDVLARANTLVQAWEPAGGNFRDQVALAGAGSATYPLDQDALNAVSDAMFYVEKELKDFKLGKPLGLIECPTPTCPQAVESPYARISTAHMGANLAGFRRLFQGCESFGTGLGFDDWLRAVGAGDLADRMLDALAGAQAAVDALSPPMEEAIVSDPAKVMVVHAAVKKLTDLLKTEFITVLNLELPKSAQGDND